MSLSSRVLDMRELVNYMLNEVYTRDELRELAYLIATQYDEDPTIYTTQELNS
jgi:hypothetical protein